MKKYFLLILFIGITICSYAQSGFDKDKVTFGGELGFQFGDYTLINIAPQVGYDFSKMFNAGAGFSYTYWKDSYYISGTKYKQSNSYLGFNVYGRFYPIENVVIMAQPEISRMWRTLEYGSNKVKDEKFIPSMILGAGLRIGPMTAMLQYDVVQDKNSPYGKNIFYSVGYMFSFR